MSEYVRAYATESKNFAELPPDINSPSWRAYRVPWSSRLNLMISLVDTFMMRKSPENPPSANELGVLLRAGQVGIGSITLLVNSMESNRGKIPYIKNLPSTPDAQSIKDAALKIAGLYGTIDIQDIPSSSRSLPNDVRYALNGHIARVREDHPYLFEVSRLSFDPEHIDPVVKRTMLLHALSHKPLNVPEIMTLLGVSEGAVRINYTSEYVDKKVFYQDSHHFYHITDEYIEPIRHLLSLLYIVSGENISPDFLNEGADFADSILRDPIRFTDLLIEPKYVAVQEKLARKRMASHPVNESHLMSNELIPQEEEHGIDLIQEHSESIRDEEVLENIVKVEVAEDMSTQIKTHKDTDKPKKDTISKKIKRDNVQGIVESEITDDEDKDEDEDEHKLSLDEMLDELFPIVAESGLAYEVSPEHASSTRRGRNYVHTQSNDSEMDAFQLYKQDLKEGFLLTEAEELMLGERVARGLEESKKEKKLQNMKIIEAGKLAINEFIEKNLRLVISVALRTQVKGLSLDDKIQEGNLGLMRAAEKYDYKKGYRFSTYATWWIWRMIIRGAEQQSRTVRLPLYVVNEIKKMYKVNQKLQQVLKRDPTLEELAEAMEITPEKAILLISNTKGPISLDEPIGEEEDTWLSDIIPDDESDTAFESVRQQLLREEIQGFLSQLKPIYRVVLEERYGLLDDQSRSLKSVGRELGITHEAVRQRETKALKKLREMMKGDLKDYLKED